MYAACWLVAVGVGVGLVAAIFGRDNSVSVPPLEETQLVAAARQSRCELRAAGPDDSLHLPVDGPPGARAATPAFYERPVATAELVAAVRRGVIVIQYRGGLDREHVDALKMLQAAVPRGTIVAPNATGMPFDVAVTAYRRLLGCARFTPKTLDAVRLFRGRYLGSGPDAAP